MLASRFRLTEKRDFQKVLKARNFSHSKFFTVGKLLGESSHPRIGIIVSNKVSKRATERNKIKRAVRMAAKEHLEKFPKGMMLVILTKPAAAGREVYEISEDVKRLFGSV